VKQVECVQEANGNEVCTRDSSATRRNSACIVCIVYHVKEHSYLQNHIGDPDVITSCNKILTHRHCRSNSPTRLVLSTASVFAFRLSGPKSLPCGSRSGRGSLHCQTSRWTRRNFTTLSRNWIPSMRRRVMFPLHNSSNCSS